MPVPSSAVRSSPAALRNRDPILGLLRAWLPPQGEALELAAGSGEHAEHFARHLPGWGWQPTDLDPDALASVEARRLAAGLPNLRPARRLDVRDSDWSHYALDLVLAVNLVHISPWACTEALLRGAARHLAPGGVLVLYGPYRVEGEPTAPSNEDFDRSLRARDPAWGLRWLGEVQARGAAEGLALVERVAMPANNLTLRFQRA